MKTDVLKKAHCFLLAILLCVGMVFTTPAPVQAAIDMLYQSDVKTAEAGVPVREDFTIPQSNTVSFIVNTAAPADFTLTIYNSASSVVDTFQIPESDSAWTPMGTTYANGASCNLNAGDYSAELTFADAYAFQLYIFVNKPEASISNKALTITAGFSKNLKVKNNTDSISWASSNPSVAAVDNSGKVTAKKAGSCTVTASTDGKNLTCKVTVKANKYTAEKYTNSDLDDGKAGMYAYAASYKADGSLKISLRMINNSGHNAEYLKNLTVKVKTAAGKTVGTYKATRLNLAVADQAYKNLSVTIPKKNLAIKNADLRNVSITPSGKFFYYTNR